MIYIQVSHRSYDHGGFQAIQAIQVSSRSNLRRDPSRPRWTSKMKASVVLGSGTCRDVGSWVSLYIHMIAKCIYIKLCILMYLYYIDSIDMYVSMIVIHVYIYIYTHYIYICMYVYMYVYKYIYIGQFIATYFNLLNDPSPVREIPLMKPLSVQSLSPWILGDIPVISCIPIIYPQYPLVI